MIHMESEMKQFVELAEKFPNYGNKKKVKHFHNLSIEL